MREKFGLSKIIITGAYFLATLITIFMLCVMRAVFSDMSIGIFTKLRDMILYFVFIIPFILLAVKSSKYYILINEDFIEINGFRKKKIIRKEDIVEIKMDNGFGGLDICYIEDKTAKKKYLQITNSIKGFKKLRKYLIYSYKYTNTRIIGSMIKEDLRLFNKDKVILSVKLIGDTEFKKPEYIEYGRKFKSSTIKDKENNIIEIKLEEVE